MELLEIKKKIHSAMRNERNTQNLAKTIMKVAKRNGKILSLEEAGEVYQKIFKSGFSFGQLPEPYWENYSFDRQVDQRLGTIGVS